MAGPKARATDRWTYAETDGVQYVCYPLPDGRQKCGKCMRGVVLSSTRKCAVCKARILHSMTRSTGQEG